MLILADDLGAGDLTCLNPDAKTATPHLDSLARDGVVFTDAHSPSAVCSPTRYGILTGRYCWRTTLKSGVLWTDDPLLIESDRPTIASELRDAGYHTAFVGKWHLGLGSTKPTDWSKPLDAGPHTVGFDESVGIPSSLDIPPYCWFRNGVGDPPPSGTIEGSTHRRQNGGGFWRAGPIADGFVHEEVLPRSIDESIAIIERHAADRPEQPLFLELCLSAPHTPWLPQDAWRGTSGAGHYGDFVNQVDAEVGRLLTALDAAGMRDDTLLVFTSDNGSHWPEADEERWGHLANGPWRGQKADIHEGGHRVPFIVRWPGEAQAGAVVQDLVSLTDLYATFAELLGRSLGEEEAEDSLSQLAAFRGTAVGVRPSMVQHSLDGMFALRAGRWKLIEARGTGGFTAPRRVEREEGAPEGQLYDLQRDPGESINLWGSESEVVARLRAELAAIRAAEHSRPGLGPQSGS
ncbi:MAG: arylsulfatase [Planctomycetota bacterium]|nr:arylsulfatase [Planctomycetota bacterium]